ncbi:choice-of-anchor P family protein [Catenulispora subtropica]|uniref:LPXTG-motif cell wall anchor domain protein n=1 Tax=Catenulispora subtropica TaxID=450798 RepID=A0ABP5D086_9ACTN
MRALRRGLASRGLGVAAAGMALCLGGTTAAQAAPAGVGGGAFGVSADVTLLAGLHLQVGPAPAVSLPAPGGSATPLTGHVVGLNVGTLAALGVLDVSTAGTPAGGSVQSTADVQNLAVPALITGDNAVHSQCTADGSGASGGSTLANLVIGGQKVAANAAPNTHVTVAGIADVTVNEQTPSGSASSPGITVTAVHIKLLSGLLGLGTGDVYAAQSRCSLTNGPEMPVGAVGGVVLTGVLGVLFTGYQVRKRRTGKAVATGAGGPGDEGTAA